MHNVLVPPVIGPGFGARSIVTQPEHAVEQPPPCTKSYVAHGGEPRRGCSISPTAVTLSLSTSGFYFQFHRPRDRLDRTGAPAELGHPARAAGRGRPCSPRRRRTGPSAFHDSGGPGSRAPGHEAVHLTHLYAPAQALPSPRRPRHVDRAGAASSSPARAVHLGRRIFPFSGACRRPGEAARDVHVIAVERPGDRHATEAHRGKAIPSSQSLRRRRHASPRSSGHDFGRFM